MNQLMPQRKDMPTCLLYMPLSDSCATVLNQPANITNSTRKPSSSITLPPVMLFIEKAAPKPSKAMATAAVIGQCDRPGT